MKKHLVECSNDEELEHGDTMIALCRFRNGVYCALVCENNVASLFWEIDILGNPFECAEVWLNQHLNGAVSHEGDGELDRYFDQQQIKDMFNEYVKSDEYPHR